MLVFKNNIAEFNNVIVKSIILSKSTNNFYKLHYGLTNEINLLRLRSINHSEYLIESERYCPDELVEKYKNTKQKLYTENEVYNRMMCKGEILSKVMNIPFFDLTKNTICKSCSNEIPEIEQTYIKINNSILIDEFENKQLKYNKLKLNFGIKMANIELNNSCLCQKCFWNLRNEKVNNLIEKYCTTIYPPQIRDKRYVPAKLRIKLLNESARWVENEQKYIPSCKFCGTTASESKLHVDHIIPWSKGGKTTESNLQVLCETCNLQKNNKHELIINV